MKNNRIRKIAICVLVLNIFLAALPQGAWAAGAAGGITLEEAAAAALAQVDLQGKTFLMTKLGEDRDDGRREYEVEFIADGIEYEYEFDAETGERLKASMEAVAEWKIQLVGGSYLAFEDAKKKVLAHAGIDAAQAVFTEFELDFSKKRVKCELTFAAGGQIYEYDLDAATGDVLKREIEKEKKQ